MSGIITAGPRSMLSKRNIALQSPVGFDDVARAMPSRITKRGDAEPPGDARTDRDAALGRLAHELNSLLDGSMRCLRLAERALGEPNEIEAADLDAVVRRLRTAEAGMKDMAALLERAMAGPVERGDRLHDHSDRTLVEEVQRVLDSVAPLAEEHGVEIHLDIAPDAGELPAGPLGAVLLNGLRNAIEACIGREAGHRRVDGSVALRGDSPDVVLCIADTGVGNAGAGGEGESTKARGHGIGLAVCRDIVRRLGGRLSLRNVPFGVGAVLEVRVPRGSLTQA